MGALSARCQRRDNVCFELRVQVVGGLDPEGQWRWLDVAGRSAAEYCQLTVEKCAREGTLVGVGVRHLSLEWEVSQTKSGPYPVDRGDSCVRQREGALEKLVGTNSLLQSQGGAV